MYTIINNYDDYMNSRLNADTGDYFLIPDIKKFKKSIPDWAKKLDMVECFGKDIYYLKRRI